ncbi:MAG: hypothetical protein KAS64_04410 [Spirochaetes bacterium]|nr:hypothetical protein [Spirochaetota bacterium]
MNKSSKENTKHIMMLTTLWVMDYLKETPGADEDTVVEFIYKISDNIINDFEKITKKS